MPRPSTQFPRSPAWALTLPATLLVVLLLLGPLAILFRYSFNRFVPGELMASALTFENYAKFASDPYYQNVLLTTLRISAASSTWATRLSRRSNSSFSKGALSEAWTTRSTASPGFFT
jgi:putative spermidine/putrescine transport system permease protein